MTKLFDNGRITVRLFADFYGTPQEIMQMIDALEIPEDRQNVFNVKYIEKYGPEENLAEFLDTKSE